MGSGMTISSSSNNPNKNKNDKTIPLEINEAPKTIFAELLYSSQISFQLNQKCIVSCSNSSCCK